MVETRTAATATTTGFFSWNDLPEALVVTVFEFLPRRDLTVFALCSRRCQQETYSYSWPRLQQTSLGRALIMRHLFNNHHHQNNENDTENNDSVTSSAEKGTFSRAFLLACVAAVPNIGQFFSQPMSNMAAFDSTMRQVYPTDIYERSMHAAWGKVMFVIDGIVVYLALEGDVFGNWRFRVCRCPLPHLARSLDVHTVGVWFNGGRGHSVTDSHGKLLGQWMENV